MNRWTHPTLTHRETPEGRPLSWKKDLKTHERRKRAAALFAQVTNGVKVIYVCSHKGMNRPDSYVADTERFYNYVAAYTFERVLMCADDWPGASQRVNIRFGQVKGIDDELTRNYFELKRYGQQWHGLPWGALASLKWVSADQYEMSQVADVYAGFMKASVWPDEFGATEGAYIQAIWHQIRRAHGCALGFGIKGMPVQEVFTGQDWWTCPCKTSRGAAKCPRGPTN